MTSQIGGSKKLKARFRLAAGIALTASLAFGMFSGAWAAPDRRGAWEHDRDRHRGWVGGYYRPPPVVYGYQPYAPPLVYAPPPGLSINIR